MRKSDPVGDFVSTTLAAITSYWGRLAYMHNIRNGAAGYRHWGMVRSYGEESAQQALSEAHYQLVRTLLAAPMSDVIRQLELFAAENGIPLEQGVTMLQETAASNVKGVSPAEREHIKAVASTVAALLASSRATQVA
jgi:hypothetical protein